MDYFDSCWLNKTDGIDTFFLERGGRVSDTLYNEVIFFLSAAPETAKNAALVFEIKKSPGGVCGGFSIKTQREKIFITAGDEQGLLYGFYDLLRRKAVGADVETESEPVCFIRMINHWDNFDGSVERGYAGASVFYDNNCFSENTGRIAAYARLLASVGINCVSINNVNVRREETRLLVKPRLDGVKTIADIFLDFGIKVFLAVNFASPMILGDLSTADPLNEAVCAWWKNAAAEIFKEIPHFGGFIVKADSEGESGPFAYGRDHSEGANCIAAALAPYNAALIWRCFVYNCHQDWRDRKTDRARAAYDNFAPLDGKFLDNVALQIKYGPMDFQAREPVSPLFGAMPATNKVLELQITQEYTGQQKHVCYLAPMWKEILEFDACAPGVLDSTVAGIISKNEKTGVAGVSNIGADYNWTGHKLAQVNLYAFGRLAFDPKLSAEQILTEWLKQTFDLTESEERIIFDICINSRLVYENYTAPLGVGWMVRPGNHYGPDVDGYEYDRWGTYHFADRDGVGVDRAGTGTGYALTYNEPAASAYNGVDTCPDELLLFFHHVPYTHILKSGKTVIQHIYDSHFDGLESVLKMLSDWKRLEGRLNDKDYINVLYRLEEQAHCARQWRDQINTYFFRKSGIPDIHGREIFK